MNPLIEIQKLSNFIPRVLINRVLQEKKLKI
jgi:hypothetical protein